MKRRLCASLPSAALLVLLAMTASSGTAGAAVGAAGSSPERAGRVLVLSLPGVTWSDLEGVDLPTLNRLLDEDRKSVV